MRQKEANGTTQKGIEEKKRDKDKRNFPTNQSRPVGSTNVPSDLRGLRIGQ